MFVKRIENLHKQIVGLMAVAAILMILGAAIAAAEPGTAGVKSQRSHVSVLSTGNSIKPVITETGKINLSLDGLGTNSESGIIQVEKPAGATVRKAYMAAASMGVSNRVLVDGDIKIDGENVIWDTTMTMPCSSAGGLRCNNHWANVTSIVKSKIDAAPAGRVNFTITEVSPYGIDGEILAVIFDDPGQANTNTVVLLFGAQAVTGDTFAIALAEPINKTDPNLELDMSLGISFGYQPSSQFSIVDVNGNRLTSSAGGQDDGAAANGALITVGGLDDSNANPDPMASPASTRTDDELYSLLSFVNNSDTSITVNTKNPSGDDNIFFAALNLKSTTAIVGEGILLTPLTATNPVGTQHTVIATIQDDKGNPIEDRDVDFTIVSGPHAGKTGTAKTNASGQAAFTYNGTSAGTDVIEASFMNSREVTITSNTVTKDWINPPPPPVPELSTMALMSIGILGLFGLAKLRRD